MTSNNDRKIRNLIRKYEGQTVGDFLYSDISEFVDVFKINGQAIPYAEDYDVDEGAVIDYINVYNVEGYIFADIATEGQ